MMHMQHTRDASRITASSKVYAYTIAMAEESIERQVLLARPTFDDSSEW